MLQPLSWVCVDALESRNQEGVLQPIILTIWSTVEDQAPIRPSVSSVILGILLSKD